MEVGGWLAELEEVFKVGSDDNVVDKLLIDSRFSWTDRSTMSIQDLISFSRLNQLAVNRSQSFAHLTEE